jgi:large subunit ribosomal protein L23
MHVYDVLRRPVVTEKSNAQAELTNQYTFEVDRRANKMQVKDAVETAFNVTVMEVNIVNIPPKKGRYGRLIVTRSLAIRRPWSRWPRGTRLSSSRVCRSVAGWQVTVAGSHNLKPVNLEQAGG